MRLFLTVVTFLVTILSTYAVARPISYHAGLLKIPNAKDPNHLDHEFLGLKRIFEVQGIPYQIIEDLNSIFSYKTVFTAGEMLNSNIPLPILNILYEYVESGGILFSSEKIGSQLYPLYGIQQYLPSKTRYRLTFSGNDPSLKYLNRPEEQTISLGNGEKDFYKNVIWTHGYKLANSSIPLATFKDKAIGFSRSNYGRGKAYLFSVSYTDMILLPQIGKDFEAQRKYVNSFEPSSDVIMLIIKAIYQKYTKPYVYLSPIPYAKTTALILTHDVDAQTSFVDSLKFAKLEKKFGVTSTFFKTTKTFVDEMDIDYYNLEENKEAIRTLKKWGYDIGSHSVSHAKYFAKIPERGKFDNLKSYNPTEFKSVYGELTVSKALLDRDIPGQNTISFRAGNLAYPYGLIRILEDTGYLYDSTFSANDVLSSFPFFALKERNLGAEESKVIEIPVTLDDALGFLTKERMVPAVEQWKHVTTAIMENNGISVLLVHPSDTRTENFKLIAQEQLMMHMQKMDAWMGDLTTYGDFFRARHQIKYQLERNKKGELVIKVKDAEPHPMIGFVVGNTKSENPEIDIVNSKGKSLKIRVILHREQ